jgi:hypothetical protein
MTRSISFSRPMTGSSLSARAASVRLMPSASTVGVLLAASSPGVDRDELLRQDADHLVADLVEVHAETLEHARAIPSPSRTRPSSRCSVPM